MALPVLFDVKAATVGARAPHHDRRQIVERRVEVPSVAAARSTSDSGAR
jgi:hypothetical protein